MIEITGGVFIIFEGIDGTGKSTQIDFLKAFLEESDYSVTVTREPTDGPYGQKIRSLYQNRQSVTLEEELELFVADRRQHIETVIQPALTSGKIVLCDRYFLSTAAYQGAAGIDPEIIFERNRFAPNPDLAFIFEISPEESIRRITENRGDVLNDFEQLESLRSVDAVFKNMDFSYIRRIDAAGTIQQVETLVREFSLQVIKAKKEQP